MKNYGPVSMNLTQNKEPTANPEQAGFSGVSGSEVLRIPNLPALSIRQPWAWLILHAGKDVENRCWPTKLRGRFLIHAAKGCTMAEFEDASDFVHELLIREGKGRKHLMPGPKEIERGGIVGEAEIVDCVRASESPWYMGDWAFVIRNAKPLPFTPCRGALGFFDPQNAKALPRGGAERTSNETQD
jgi:hypothetical protein